MQLHLLTREKGTELKTLLTYIKQSIYNLPPTDIVCFTYQEIQPFLPEGTQPLLQAFLATKLDLLFCADTECHPWKHTAPLYKQTLSLYKYLNAGAYIGTVAALKSILNTIDSSQSPSDQAFFTFVYINYLHEERHPIKSLKIGLDSECRIFQIADTPLPAHIYVLNGKLYNRTERSTPFFLYSKASQPIPKKPTPTPTFAPKDTEIVACAKAAAQRYICPNQTTIHLRDQVNNHAIIQGTRFIQDVNENTMHVEFAKTNRRIIEQYFERIGSSNTLLLDISLHDYVGSHMNNSKWPHSVLGFSKFKDDHTNVLIPDLYAMQNYRGMLEANLSDNLPTQKKINKLFFIGSSYGPTNTESNARVRVCKFAQGKNWIEAYISKVIHFEEKQLADYLHAPISMQEQYTYRHILVIDGNTVCWDRLPWVLASRCVCWKLESEEECWYYEFLKPWVHYIPFTIDTIEETWNKVKDDYKLQQQIVRNANEFVEDFLTSHAHALYTKTLLDEIAIQPVKDLR